MVLGVVVVRGVPVPLLGMQLIDVVAPVVVPAAGVDAVEPTVPTCEGGGVAAVGC